MPELELAPAPPPDACRRLVAQALTRWVPGWTLLAEDLLGADARIDLLGCDATGRATIALLGLEPRSDLALVASGLAQRDWLAARLPGLAQLAAGAGLDPEAGTRVLLLAPEFRPTALAAAGAATDLEPLRLRFVRVDGGEIAALLEPGEGGLAVSAPRPNGAAGFRSGLSAEDLDLTLEEIAELER